jgi:DNA-binding NarL/FixJ family response regulator
MDGMPEHNVWIVEDDPVFRESLKQLIPLDQNLKLFLVVDSVEKAFEYIPKLPAPQVILQDVGLPGISGIEAIPFYKKEYPDVKVIILTIFDDDERVFEAIKNGADGYLLKRTPGTEILKGIKEMLAGGAPISPEIAKKMLGLLSGKNSSPKKESNLTKREQTILEYLVEGFSIDMISAELHISSHTVDTHAKNIYRKLQVHSRGEVVSKALKEGLV